MVKDSASHCFSSHVLFTLQILCLIIFPPQAVVVSAIPQQTEIDYY
ncbi:hypothetical protein CSC14_2750 [Proteus mirabilis]|nr:hypothetical protein HMPREF3203_02046 [Proteus mirabilis]PVF73354.1 hypothetical protein CSC14_2750 [Proteus mirabilis]